MKTQSSLIINNSFFLGDSKGLNQKVISVWFLTWQIRVETVRVRLPTAALTSQQKTETGPVPTKITTEEELTYF